MAGVTPLPLVMFRGMLRARGLDLGAFADRAQISRHHLSQILWGHFKGANLWAQIRATATAEEWRVLLDVENCATWNKAQLAKGPNALVWLLRVECADCNEFLKFKPCEAAQAGEVSHGLCPDCLDVKMRQLDELLPPAPAPRAYLVNTEAGLAVHHAATAPALASNRELTAEDFAGDVRTAPIVCRLERKAS